MYENPKKHAAAYCGFTVYFVCFNYPSRVICPRRGCSQLLEPSDFQRFAPRVWSPDEDVFPLPLALPVNQFNETDHLGSDRLRRAVSLLRHRGCRPALRRRDRSLECHFDLVRFLCRHAGSVHSVGRGYGLYRRIGGRLHCDHPFWLFSLLCFRFPRHQLR